MTDKQAWVLFACSRHGTAVERAQFADAMLKEMADRRLDDDEVREVKIVNDVDVTMRTGSGGGDW